MLKKPYLRSKICNINFWIGNDPPLLELFRKFIRFGDAILPLGGQLAYSSEQKSSNRQNLIQLTHLIEAYPGL